MIPVRHINNHGKGTIILKSIIVILVIVIAYIILLVSSRSRKKHIVKETMSTVEGTIRGVDRKDDIDLDGHRQTEYYWIIEYRVRSTRYTLKQRALLITYRQMQANVGSSVIVHYVPSRAYQAWAETPGQQIVDNESAAGQLIRDADAPSE